ncbi:MAG: hypothetical protein EOP51_32415, partial [Sphingobacteriales bacterium]
MRNLTQAFCALLFVAIIASSCSKVYQDEIHSDLLKGISVDSTSLNMLVGEQRQIPITTNPANYSLDSLNWISSDTAVLYINNTGLITARSAGTSTVTISSKLDTTLSATVLVTVTEMPVDSLQAGLVAYYPFNNSAADSSGNNYNGTAFDVLPTTDRHNNTDAAFQFNGSSSYITVDDADALRLHDTDFTLNAWVKLDDYSPTNCSMIFSKRVSGYNTGWTWGMAGTGGTVPAGVSIFGPGGAGINAVGSVSIDVEKWHMVTCVYKLSANEMLTYIDGVYDNTSHNISPPNALITATLY